MNIKLIYKICFISLCSLGFSGCELLTPPIEKPIIEDHSLGISTLGTIPSRRMVILNPLHNPSNGQVFVCAEPSPDVSDNIASALAAAASASTTAVNPETTASLTANLSKSLATTAQFLFKRSQGVQLYRDGMYNLCQAKMNRIITEPQYIELSKELLGKSVELINTEIPTLYKVDIPNVDRQCPETTVDKEGHVTTKITLCPK